jgi:hypothetical protein
MDCSVRASCCSARVMLFHCGKSRMFCGQFLARLELFPVIIRKPAGNAVIFSSHSSLEVVNQEATVGYVDIRVVGVIMEIEFWDPIVALVFCDEVGGAGGLA